MFSQSSLVSSVGGGAGALRSGMAANQTGNLLGTDVLIHSPEVKVGRNDHPGGVKKKRFGSTGVNHEFDYPVHKVHGDGNGQAYPQSKAGYLPGNGGDGLAGYGCGDPHAFEFNEAINLTEAKEIAMREAHQMPHFVKPEHFMYVDKTHETLKQQMIDQAQDYQRERIKDLMNKGFSEDEITKMLEKERERAILKAENHPVDAVSLMRAAIAKQLPVRMNEDYGNTSVAPGAIAKRQDMSSHEKAVGAGNPVAQRKKNEAIRHEQRISGQVSRVEPPIRAFENREQMDVLRLLTGIAKKEKAAVEEIHHETAIETIKEQERKVDVIEKQKEHMLRAIADKSPKNLMNPTEFPKVGGFRSQLEGIKEQKKPGRPLMGINESGEKFYHTRYY